MTTYKTYFDILPYDLIKQYFLNNFSLEDILEIMPQLINISPFNKLFKTDLHNIWKDLWRRDISEVRIPEKLTYNDYVEKIESYLQVSPNDYGRLMEAVEKGYEKMVYHLLKKSTIISDYEDALFDAALYGYLDMVGGIINLGKLNISSLNVALFEAVRGGQIDVVRLLLDKGAQVAENMLIQAVDGNNPEIAEMLLEAGATDVNRALSVANYYQERQLGDYNEMIELLESYQP